MKITNTFLLAILFFAAGIIFVAYWKPIVIFVLMYWQAFPFVLFMVGVLYGIFLGGKNLFK